MPAEISAPLHFRTLLGSHKYFIVDFFATWCPPCKVIAPVYEQLSKTHTVPGKIEFAKLNVDNQPELAAQYGIQSIPTFLIFKDGKQIEEIKSANAPALKNSIEKIAAEVKSQAAQEKPAEAKVEAKKDESEVFEEKEEKTVSGSYGMTGGNNWKQSLY